MNTKLKNSPGIRAVRNALGRYPTGVAIVCTYNRNSQPVGMTINSLTSVSLSPALLSWCVDHNSPSYPIFTMTKYFAVTVLAANQVNLARKFATRGADKFSDLELDGRFAPVIPGAAAWFECETCQTLPLGDHSMLVGRILDFSMSSASPLIFSGGKFVQLDRHETTDFREVA